MGAPVTLVGGDVEAPSKQPVPVPVALTAPPIHWASTPAKGITVGSCLVGAVTIIVCYVLAVVKGDVPIWLPMISDTFVDPPMSYISRFGIISAGILIWLNCILFWFYVNSPGFEDLGRNFSISNNLAMILATLASIGLMVVGAVNEDEDNTIHSTGAVVFFLGFILYMCLVTRRLAKSSHVVNPTSLHFKTVACVVGLVMFVLFVLMSQNWSKYGTDIAICEWSGTFIILLFNLSYLWEFGKDEYVAVAVIDDQE